MTVDLLGRQARHQRWQHGGMVRSAALFSCVKRSSPVRHQRGFTLVELIVAVGISVILVSLAVPAMQDTLTAKAVSSAAGDLSDALRIARSEALKHGTPVSVCSSTTANDASPACSDVASWASGWVVFMDADNNGTIDATDVVLKVFRPGSGVSAITEASAKRYFWIQGNGLATGGAGSFLVEPKISSSANGYANATRRVCLFATGSIAVKVGSGAC